MNLRFARAGLAGALILLVACQPAPPSTAGVDAASGEILDADAPVARDAPALREAAANALAGQRIYAPAGDNALEFYLDLRSLEPQDPTIGTALLELLPYALIGSEQAIARGDLDEARRLVGLMEQVDASAAMLGRLRDDITTAETQSAARVVAEAEQARLREQQLAEAQARTEQERLAAATAAVATPPTPPVARITLAEATAAGASPSRDPGPAIAAAPTENNVAAASAPARAAAPRLLSAPPPRYPLAALRRKIEGEVTLAFRIQPDGSVAEPRVVSSSPAGLFEEAAIAAANRWRFESTGSAVAGSRVVQFRLKAAE